MLWGLLAIAALTAAGFRLRFGYPEVSGRYRALSRAEVAFVASAAEAMYPPGGAIASSGSDAELPAYLDRFLVASVPRIRILIHLLLFLVEHATLFFPAPGWTGRRRFTALSADQRVAVLDGYANSSLFLRRLVFTTLRALLTMGYFAHPPVLRALHLAPYEIDTPVVAADLLYPRIGQHPRSIEWTTDDLRPVDAPPLALDAPIHPEFREPAA